MRISFFSEFLLLQEVEEIVIFTAFKKGWGMRFFLGFCLLFVSTFSQATQNQILSTYVLRSPNPALAQILLGRFSVEGRRGGDLEIIVSADQVTELRTLAPQAELVEADRSAAAQARLRQFWSFYAGTSQYHSFDQVQAWMTQKAQEFPSQVQVVDYGLSQEGRPLRALRLNFVAGIDSANPVSKKVALLTAATHGDELITTEVLLGLVDRLLLNRGTDSRLAAILERVDLYVVPVVNPDGFVATSRWDGNQDPNRSYPFPGNKGGNPSPSIQGVIRLFDQIHPVGSIDFHAFGGLIMYPWAYSREVIGEPQHGRFDAVAQSMAATNGYTYGQISRILYAAPGSSADYYFWKNGTLSFGIELGQEKIPAPFEIPQYTEEMAEGSWRFLEAL